jgi:class 3 adenylate cyclase
MNDAHRPNPEAPQLRTLLLTDLCDSTTLVERLGDTTAWCCNCSSNGAAA